MAEEPLQILRGRSAAREQLAGVEPGERGRKLGGTTIDAALGIAGSFAEPMLVGVLLVLGAVAGAGLWPVDMRFSDPRRPDRALLEQRFTLGPGG